MMKTIFAISDIHGYYYKTLDALKEAGWDEQNPDHLLIVCGDMFDRGEESLEIFEWIYRLTKEGKAIALKGNHEPMFIEWLSGPVTNFNYKYNGMNKTIDSFDGRTESFFSWIMIDKGLDMSKLTLDEWDKLWYDWSLLTKNSILYEYPVLLDWLKNLPDYYTTQNYIFTHGSIQTYGDWQNPEHGWNWHHWDKGEFFGEKILNTNKTIVVGHFSTDHIRKVYHLDNGTEDFSILTSSDKRKIYIDGCVPYTNKVNVLKIENEELIPTENKE